MDTLTFDRLSNSFVLNTEDGPEFLGPITFAMGTLQHLDMSAAQAREAVVSAVFSEGRPIDLEYIRRRAIQDYLIPEE